MLAIKFPNEIWLEIIRHRHNGNLQSVCKLFNEYIEKNKIQFLRSGFGLPLCKNTSRDNFCSCENCFEKTVLTMFGDDNNTRDKPPKYIQSNYVMINAHTMHYSVNQWDSAVILRVPGGRCAWIEYAQNGNVNWTISWVINNTSLSKQEFITFCADLMVKLLSRYTDFFRYSLIEFNNGKFVPKDTYESHADLFPLISYK